MTKSVFQSEVCTEYARTLIRVKARQLVRRSGFSRSDQDDVEQELVLNLLGQARRYDPDRASMSTFIARVVDSGVAMLLRKRKRQKRAPGLSAQSLELLVGASTGKTQLLGATLSGEDRDRRLGRRSLSDLAIYVDAEAFDFAMRGLPSQLLEIVSRVMESSPAAAARDLGISRRQVAAALVAVRQHFERAGFGND
jgi:RNA polymerase sigma-70 factor, ECF subfamily